MRKCMSVALVLAACVLAGNGATGTMKPGYAIHVNGLRPAHNIGHNARYLTAAKLARGINTLCARGSGGCALKGQAFVIERVAHEQHLNPGVMVAISFTESSGGDSPCQNNRLSIWGLNSCNGGNFINGPVPIFRTWYEAFSYFAKFLKSRWPSATTVYGLGGYSACDSCWQPRTALWASRLGFSPTLAYGL